MKINRDFTIIILKSYYNIVKKKLNILDCMTATGVRSIRILREIPEVVNKIYINDIKKEAIENIKENLKINNLKMMKE
jgi:N2,N2-dimethylguanosine tRNA methyltransferase